jgi:hypothetical protein
MTNANDFDSSTSPVPRDPLDDMLYGLIKTQMIGVVCKLGIPDMLKDGPKSIENLSSAIGANQDSLYRLLRGLAAQGLFASDEDSRFGLTPLGNYLRTDYPGSQHQFALNLTGSKWDMWAKLDQIVMTGNTFSMLTERAGYYGDGSGRTHFNRNMAVRDLAVRGAVIAAYDFSGISTLVDVGGGYGQYIFAILDKYPNMRGVLFDLPATIKEADKETAADPTRERCDLIGGSYFEALPEGDACWVKSVIMDNADEQAITILSNCRQAVGDHGKVILVERILLRPQDVFMDMIMMADTGGRVRTEGELRTLITTSGLKLKQVIPTPSQYSVLECVPA